MEDEGQEEGGKFAVLPGRSGRGMRVAEMGRHIHKEMEGVGLGRCLLTLT